MRCSAIQARQDLHKMMTSVLTAGGIREQIERKACPSSRKNRQEDTLQKQEGSVYE